MAQLNILPLAHPHRKYVASVYECLYMDMDLAYRQNDIDDSGKVMNAKLPPLSSLGRTKTEPWKARVRTHMDVRRQQ